MQHSRIFAVLVTASMLTACTEPNGEPGRGIEHGGALSKTDVGVAIGAVAGGVGGAFIGAGWGEAAAIAGGAVIGGAVGGGIGHELDKHDQRAYDRASQRAMNTGSEQTWNNEDTGHHGTIHPHKYYKDAQGRTCRHYTHTSIVDGKSQETHGKACREKDGSWKTIK